VLITELAPSLLITVMIKRDSSEKDYN
jgi:hypothetical protein